MRFEYIDGEGDAGLVSGMASRLDRDEKAIIYVTSVEMGYGISEAA